MMQMVCNYKLPRDPSKEQILITHPSPVRRKTKVLTYHVIGATKHSLAMFSLRR